MSESVRLQPISPTRVVVDRAWGLGCRPSGIAPLWRCRHRMLCSS